LGATAHCSFGTSSPLRGLHGGWSWFAVLVEYPVDIDRLCTRDNSRGMAQCEIRLSPLTIGREPATLAMSS
jgi:hypothetical protein